MLSSELTDAEILGDMDGAILGTIIPMINKPLSEILHDYYEGSGVDAGGRKFKASARVATFGELLPDYELEAQSQAFSKAFYRAKDLTRFGQIYNGTSKEYLLNKVPSTVKKLYKKLYTPCPSVLEDKYTINYFLIW